MVSAASLQNLTPMPSKWGVATQAIRIPVELTEEIFEMVNQRMQALKEIVLANPKNEWIEVPTDQEDIEEMLAEEPNPVYERMVAEFQAKVVATPEGQAHLAKLEEVRAEWEKLGLLDEPPTSNDALISAIQQPPQAEENINDWLLRQPGYKIETYVLDEGSGELLEQQPPQQEQSTLATKSKQQAKRDRRLNQAKKSGALSGKGFAVSTPKSEIEEKKLLYKNAEILFAKENAKLRKRYADLMQKTLLTCTPGKLQLFEDVTKVCNDFLGSTLKYTTTQLEWEAYFDSKTYYRDFVEGKIPASKTAGGINDQFLSLIFEGLECWVDCYLTVQLG